MWLHGKQLLLDRLWVRLARFHGIQLVRDTFKRLDRRLLQGSRLAKLHARLQDKWHGSGQWVRLRLNDRWLHDRLCLQDRLSYKLFFNFSLCFLKDRQTCLVKE